MSVIRPHKQIILVRKDLKMKSGKLAAQVAHASMGVILDLMNNGDVTKCQNDWTCADPRHRPVVDWLTGSFAKICVKVDDLAELEHYEQVAGNRKIPLCKITDSGRTMFNNEPTVTCMAIGPWWTTELDEFLSELKLL